MPGKFDLVGIRFEQTSADPWAHLKFIHMRLAEIERDNPNAMIRVNVTINVVDPAKTKRRKKP